MLSGVLNFLPGTCTYNKTAIYEDGSNDTLETKIECDSWIYDTSEFSLTITSEVYLYYKISLSAQNPNCVDLAAPSIKLS